MLVEAAKSQDIEAGDGTTTVAVLIGALLDSCESLLTSKGIHPTLIASSFLQACTKCIHILRDISKPVDLQDRESLLSAVETCLASKVVAANTDLLAPIAVDSVLQIMESPNNSTSVDLRDIRIVQQVGGTVDDSELVQGLVLQKGSNKAAAGGVSQQDNAKIALLQYCLSAPKTDIDNTVVVSDYAAMDRILREERKYILNQCKIIKKSGANAVLIQKSILRDAYNELSLHFLAKMGILVVTDIERGDVDFICRTLGCTPIAHPDQCKPEKLGHAKHVGDVVMEGGGGGRVVKFTGIQDQGKTVTVLLRGSNDLVLAEASRSLHDAQCVIRCLVKERALIAGGGAAEAHCALKLGQYAQSLTGVDAHCMQAFADALEVIPYTLAENAGMKPIEVVTELRKQHSEGVTGAGINVKKGKVTDMYDLNVIQPLLVTTSALQLATETVCMILKIDDLVVVA
jgi:T-complex protein 1 subunit delta